MYACPGICSTYIEGVKNSASGTQRSTVVVIVERHFAKQKQSWSEQCWTDIEISDYIYIVQRVRSHAGLSNSPPQRNLRAALSGDKAGASAGQGEVFSCQV